MSEVCVIGFLGKVYCNNYSYASELRFYGKKS